VWVLAIWSIYRLAELVRAETGLGSAGWAGCIGASLWLLDPGASREGGWNYLMFHGVWPQLLSTALWTASIPLVWRALNDTRPRSMALAALALGGSVLAHPFGMLTCAGSAVLWPVVLWGTGRLRSLPTGTIRRWLTIHLLGGLICVGWVATFLASSSAMSRSPVPWQALGELATDLLAGELFTSHRAWVGPLAVVGLVLAVRRSSVLGWMCLSSLLGMLVLASEASVTVLRFDLLVSAFKNIQFPRHAIAMKPMWCALAGLGASALWSAARASSSQPAPEVPRRPSLGSVRIGRWLACLCLAPIVLSILEDRSRLQALPVGGIHTIEGSVYENDEARLREAIEAEVSAHADRTTTVAFLRRGMMGGTYPLFAIADANAHLVLDGHIPAVNYRHRIQRRTPKSLRAIGVTHVIYDLPLEEVEEELAAEIEPIGVFGPYTFARLPDEGAVLSRLSPTIDHDRGVVRLVSHTAEHIVLEVDEVDAPARVVLALGPYRKWIARDEAGRSVPMRARERRGGIPGIALEVSHNGRVDLRYETPAVERVLGWISLSGVGLCVLILVLGGRPRELATRLHSPMAVRISWILGITTAIVIVAFAVRHQRHQMARTWKAVAKQHARETQLADDNVEAFDRDLIAAGDYSVIASNPDRCDGLVGKNAREGCSEAAERPRVSMMYRSPYLYRCLRVQVPAAGSVKIVLEDLEGDQVVGFFKRVTPGRRGGKALEYAIDGLRQRTKAGDRRRHFQFEAGEHGGQLRIELSNGGRKPETVCVAAATTR
jgi:hypothetical protein